MSKKDKDWKLQWKNLTEIGKLFGLTSVSVGSFLKEVGLRNSDGTPSEAAISNNYVKIIHSNKYNTDTYMWKAGIVSDLLQKNGHRHISKEDRKINQFVKDLRSILRGCDRHPGQEKLYYMELDSITDELDKSGLREKVIKLLTRSERENLGLSG